MLPATLQFLIVMIGCSLNERMQKRLDYKREEVLILKGILQSVTGKARIDFTEAQRRRLAVVGKDLTPKERSECCEIVKPRTILDWFRRIYSAKYDSSQSPRKKGRPPKPQQTRDLVIRLALENLSWGYTKIRDVVKVGLGIDICRNTVANILNKAGIVPAPELSFEPAVTAQESESATNGPPSSSFALPHPWPQQTILPSLRSAQFWKPSADTSANSPGGGDASMPQHTSAPDARMPQLSCVPAKMLANSPLGASV